MITQICPPHLKNVTALTCEKKLAFIFSPQRLQSLSHYTLLLKRYTGLPLKCQDKNSDFFRTFQDLKYQNISTYFLPFLALTYEFDSRTRHCETKNATTK